MTNKKLGNDFESRFCEILSDERFWTHNFAQNQAGQPADIIAVRNGKAYLIDCKVCSNGRFDLSRMEDNQDLSMEHWRDCGNGDGWFALLLEGHTVCMISHFTIRAMQTSKSSLCEDDILALGVPLAKWVSHA